MLSRTMCIKRGVIEFTQPQQQVMIHFDTCVFLQSSLSKTAKWLEVYSALGSFAYFGAPLDVHLYRTVFLHFMLAYKSLVVLVGSRLSHIGLQQGRKRKVVIMGNCRLSCICNFMEEIYTNRQMFLRFIDKAFYIFC